MSTIFATRIRIPQPLPPELHQQGNSSAFSRIWQNEQTLAQTTDPETFTKIFNYCLKDAIDVLDAAKSHTVEDLERMTMSHKDVSDELYALASMLVNIDVVAERRMGRWERAKVSCPVIQNDGWDLGRMGVSGYASLDTARDCLSNVGRDIANLAEKKAIIAAILESA